MVEDEYVMILDPIRTILSYHIQTAFPFSTACVLPLHQETGKSYMVLTKGYRGYTHYVVLMVHQENSRYLHRLHRPGPMTG